MPRLQPGSVRRGTLCMQCWQGSPMAPASRRPPSPGSLVRRRSLPSAACRSAAAAASAACTRVGSVAAAARPCMAASLCALPPLARPPLAAAGAAGAAASAARSPARRATWAALVCRLRNASRAASALQPVRAATAAAWASVRVPCTEKSDCSRSAVLTGSSAAAPPAAAAARSGSRALALAHPCTMGAIAAGLAGVCRGWQRAVGWWLERWRRSRASGDE